MHRDLVGAGVGQTRDRHRRRRSGVEGKVGVQKVVLGGTTASVLRPELLSLPFCSMGEKIYLAPEYVNLATKARTDKKRHVPSRTR